MCWIIRSGWGQPRRRARSNPVRLSTASPPRLRFALRALAEAEEARARTREWLIAARSLSLFLFRFLFHRQIKQTKRDPPQAMEACVWAGRQRSSLKPPGELSTR